MESREGKGNRRKGPLCIMNDTSQPCMAFGQNSDFISYGG